MGKQAPAALASPQPSSLAATSLVVAPGTSSAVSEATTAAEKEAKDAAAVKKAMEDVVVAKRTSANKRGTDVAAGEKAVSGAAAMEGTISEAGSWNMVDYSPAPVSRAKRAAISGGSTPLPSVGSVAPGSLGMLSDPAFVLPFFYAYFVSLGLFVVQCVSLQQGTYPQD
jgi:hypothetical protein